MVGFAHAYVTGEGNCKLDKIYVSTDLQRHGIGSLLMGDVEYYARQKACEQLILRVNKRNIRAIAAYQKYGFWVASALTEDIGNEFIMDDYVMAKSL